jgi:hypothetical protein
MITVTIVHCMDILHVNRNQVLKHVFWAMVKVRMAQTHGAAQCIPMWQIRNA